MDRSTFKARIRTLVNTPLKKLMFGFQLLSYVLIVASPAIGAAIGKVLDLKAGPTAAWILGIFIAGEILFYGSLAFLGKEIVFLIRDLFKSWFSRIRNRRNTASDQSKDV